MMTRTSSQFPVLRGVARRSAVILAAVFVTLLGGAAPAAADWLVTLEGKLIETRGSWTVDDDVVVYVDLEGVEQKMRVVELDLEGSADTTEGWTGRRPELPPSPPVEKKAEAKKKPPRPDVILYATSWCGYCRKARRLLSDLKVDYVEKDIEKDREAGREFARRFGRSGIPVIDVDGKVVRGYDEPQIRRLVRKLKKARAESS